jgi:hypothetical protein
MGILLTKPKPKLQPVLADKELSTFAALIDEVGELSEQAEPIIRRMAALQEQLKPYVAKVKELEEKANEYYADEDADEEFTPLGQKFQLKVGKKGNSRKIVDLKQVMKIMGQEAFLKVATVPLKDIDQYLSGAQKDKVINTERVKRTVKPVEKRVT